MTKKDSKTCSLFEGCANPTTNCRKCNIALCDEHEKEHVGSCPYHDAHMKGSEEYDEHHGTTHSHDFHHVSVIKAEARELCRALLDDDNGISEEAYHLLRSMIIDPLKLSDISVRVKATDGRFYLRT